MTALLITLICIYFVTQIVGAIKTHREKLKLTYAFKAQLLRKEAYKAIATAKSDYYIDTVIKPQIFEHLKKEQEKEREILH